MDVTIRKADPIDAAEISSLVHHSFTILAASDWSESAVEVFLSESSPPALRDKLECSPFAAVAFAEERIVGFVMLTRPNLLGMLFVHPDFARQGVGRSLWENAREFLEAECLRV